MVSKNVLKSLGFAKAAAVTAGVGILGWAAKEIYQSNKEKKKHQAHLTLLIREILQERINNYLNPRLFTLREFYQSHWDAITVRAENQKFWKDWLSELTLLDKTPAVGIDWSSGRREKLMMDLGAVRF